MEKNNIQKKNTLKSKYIFKKKNTLKVNTILEEYKDTLINNFSKLKKEYIYLEEKKEKHIFKAIDYEKYKIIEEILEYATSLFYSYFDYFTDYENNKLKDYFFYFEKKMNYYDILNKEITNKNSFENIMILLLFIFEKKSAKENLNLEDSILGLVLLSIYQNKKNKKKIKNIYPYINDNNFNVKLNSKREFRENFENEDQKLNNDNNDNNNKKLNRLEKSDDDDNFSLSNSQIFLQNFISPRTHYNSILLFHGTGIGKTCTAIQIAEQFIPYIRNNLNNNGINKIIVLAQPNIQSNFRNQLADIDKYLENKNIFKSCLGKKYIDDNEETITDSEHLKKISNILIEENYKFFGYTEFCNEVEKVENSGLKKLKLTNEEDIENYKIKKRKDYFSNVIFIIDEAHNIKRDKESDNKKTPVIIQNVIKDAENSKLILLSATPMHDKSTEIIFLLNLLLLNDKRPILKESDIFDNEGSLTENGKKTLLVKSRGYISYIQGKKKNFPYRLSPEDNNDKNIIKKENYPKYNYRTKEKINQEKQLKYLKLNGYELTNYQYQIYKSHLQNNFEKDNSNQFGDALFSSLNIVFPENTIKEEGLEKCFNIINKKYYYKPQIKKNYGSFLKEDLIEKYSIKFKHILNYIKNSTGIIFIYTRYIGAGIKPLALFLEQNGFSKYSEDGGDDNLLGEERELISYDGKMQSSFKDNSLFKKANYVTIIGETPEIRNDLDRKNIINSINNKYGERIKVVLASKAGGEGIDLHNIREVHILEPWHNLSTIEQAIGRGIRQNSHIELNKDECNTTIYLHSTLNPKTSVDKDIETYDYYIYRMAENKYLKIAEVEHELKKNALNCLATKPTNLFLKDEIIKLKTSQNKIIMFNIKDKPFSNECNFKKDCNYKCNLEDDILKAEEDTSTYDISFGKKYTLFCKKIIKSMFLEDSIYTLDNFINRINKNNNISEMFIYNSLEEIINNKEIIYDKFKRKGVVIYKNLYYMFQPLYKIESDLNDDFDFDFNFNEITIPVSLKKRKFIVLPKNETFKYKENNIIKDAKYIYEENEKKFNLLYDKLFKNKNIFSKYSNIILKQCIFNCILDRINIEDKIIIIKDLIINQILYKKQEDNNKFYSTFEYNFIKLNNSNNNICGFILNDIIYKYLEESHRFIIINDKKWLKDKIINTKMNNKPSDIYGFLEWEEKKNNYLFKFITNVKLVDNFGTGKNCLTNDADIIIKTINKLMDNKYEISKNKKEYMCYYLEILLRYNQAIQKNNLSWFSIKTNNSI